MESERRLLRIVAKAGGTSLLPRIVETPYSAMAYETALGANAAVTIPAPKSQIAVVDQPEAADYRRREAGYRSRGQYYYDDYDRRGGRRGGWYGDPESHAEASRRGSDDPRHGESGWHGDPEGHSEASRRGWEQGHRGYGGGGYRGRYEDEDYYERRGRGRGG